LLLGVNSKQHGSSPVILITFIILFVAQLCHVSAGYEIQLPFQNGKKKLQCRQLIVKKRAPQLGVFYGRYLSLVALPAPTAPLTAILLVYCTKVVNLTLGFHRL